MKKISIKTIGTIIAREAEGHDKNGNGKSLLVIDTKFEGLIFHRVDNGRLYGMGHGDKVVFEYHISGNSYKLESITAVKED